MLTVHSSTKGIHRTTVVAGMARGVIATANALANMFRWAKAAVSAYRGRAIVLKMHTLDDRMLSDIGLCRGDLGSALASDGLTDPTVRLRIMAVERRAGIKAQARERLEAARLAEIEEAARTAVGEAIAPRLSCPSTMAR